MRNNPTGYTNQVVALTAAAPSYTFSPEDAGVSIQAGWGGGTVTLPGPNTGNPAGSQLPANGDKYWVADPQNVILLNAKVLTINGGGYKFLSGGAMVTQATINAGVNGISGSTNGAVQSTCLCFTFDSVGQVWIVGYGQ